MRIAISLPPLELGRASLQKSGCTFLLVLGRSANGKQRSFEAQAFFKARLRPFVYSLDGKLHAQRTVGVDLVQDGFGSLDKIGARNDFIHKADAIGFLCVDRVSRKNDLQRPALAHQARKPLRAAIARHNSQLHFRLAELRGLRSDANSASHGQLTSTAKREAVDRRYDGLTEVL